MAFSPFNIFRRNQRVLFAIITVFIMFTFVLSSGMGGGADFFDVFPTWLRSRSEKGTVLCSIDGAAVTEGTLNDPRTGLRPKRMLANEFMSRAAQQSLDNAIRSLADQATRASDKEKQELFAGIATSPQLVRDALAKGQAGPREVFRYYQDRQQKASAVLAAPNVKPDDADAARTALFVLDTDARLLNQILNRTTGLYFENQPNKTDRDGIEFELWAKKADRLGIKFTEKDVKRMVLAEFAVNGLSQFKDDVGIRRALAAEYKGFNEPRLYDALAAEFKVRAAQTTVLGVTARRPNATLTAPPVYPTPFDQLAYFREQCSPTSYAALSVPVANFVDKVPAGPADQGELVRLFDKHKKDEPNPALERPGFKEPRKVSVAWIGATGNEPFYAAAAREWVKASDLQARLGGLMSFPVTTVGPAWVVNAKLATETDLPFTSSYEGVRQKFDSERTFQYGGNSALFEPLDSSVVRRGNLAAAAGGAAGSLLNFGSPHNAHFTLEQAAKAYERRDRIKVGLPVVLGMVPNPGLFATGLAGVAASRASLPQVPPVEVYRAELDKKLIEDKARDFLTRHDLTAFQREVAKRAAEDKTPDKAAVKAYIKDFVAARGLQSGATTEPRDEFNVGDDPGVAPLKATAGAAVHGLMPVQFGKRFFYDAFLDKHPEMMGRVPFDQLMSAPDEPATGTYQPKPYTSSRFDPGLTPGETRFVFWRTEEVAPKELSYNDKAKPRVLAAWKRAKARELAKAEADRLAAEFKPGGATNAVQIDQRLRELALKLRGQAPDDAGRDRVKQFDIADVAPLVSGRNPVDASRPTMLKAFALKADTNIPYPTPEMEKALLAERTKPVNTAVVLADGPRETYYLAVVTGRDEKTPDEFAREVYLAPLRNPAGEPNELKFRILGGAAEEAATRAREAALALIKAELRYEKEATDKLDDKNRSSDFE